MGKIHFVLLTTFVALLKHYLVVKNLKRSGNMLLLYTSRKKKYYQKLLSTKELFKEGAPVGTSPQWRKMALKSSFVT